MDENLDLIGKSRYFRISHPVHIMPVRSCLDPRATRANNIGQAKLYIDVIIHFPAGEKGSCEFIITISLNALNISSALNLFFSRMS
jgi:hypothetical protein